jgi:hypothetical protein
MEDSEGARTRKTQRREGRNVKVFFNRGLRGELRLGILHRRERRWKIPFPELLCDLCVLWGGGSLGRNCFNRRERIEPRLGNSDRSTKTGTVFTGGNGGNGEGKTVAGFSLWRRIAGTTWLTAEVKRQSGRATFVESRQDLALGPQ